MQALHDIISQVSASDCTLCKKGLLSGSWTSLTDWHDRLQPALVLAHGTLLAPLCDAAAAGALLSARFPTFMTACRAILASLLFPGTRSRCSQIKEAFGEGGLFGGASFPVQVFAAVLLGAAVLKLVSRLGQASTEAGHRQHTVLGAAADKEPEPPRNFTLEQLKASYLATHACINYILLHAM
jgi:hypothetical protein